MRQSLAESLAHAHVRSFREYITEAGLATVSDASSIGDSAMGGGMAGANQMFNLHHGDYYGGAYDPAIIGGAEGLAQHLRQKYGESAARAAARNARDRAQNARNTGKGGGGSEGGYNPTRAGYPFGFALQRIGGEQMYPDGTDQYFQSYRARGIDPKEVQAARRNMRQGLQYGFGGGDQGKG